MDSLTAAREALAAGDPSATLRHGWKAATLAARVQDDVTLGEIARLAGAAALECDGAMQADAQRLQAYCEACVVEPRDPADGFWGLGRMFSRGQRRKACPDCAESIALRARVCRFCGYRYPDLPTPGASGPST